MYKIKYKIVKIAKVSRETKGIPAIRLYEINIRPMRYPFLTQEDYCE